MQATIQLIINGQMVQTSAEPDKTLLDFLRNDMRLTGTKRGCEQGECGACSVLVNGEAVNSCMLYLQGLDGAQVTTIEGLAQNGELDGLQKAFIEYGAIQCGFCSPGQIIAAKALLLKNPHPSEDEIKTALSGNLCRCTGYQKIIEAVKVAAGYPPAEKPQYTGDYAVLGSRPPRKGIKDKATGALQYADDLDIPGLLAAKAKRSEYPHALIRNIDYSAAASARGVVAILTAEDIPGTRLCGQGVKDMPILAFDRVRSCGDVVAVAVAETEAQAEAALQMIKVDYEVLPVIANIEQALAPDAVQIHETGNLKQLFKVRKGNVDDGFAQCTTIVEDTFRTQLIEHAYMETECGVAYYDQGVLTVCTPTQEVYSDRRHIATSLCLPQNRVRVIQTPSGGAFGGKIDISTEIIVALATYKTGRPVKYRFSREESMAASPKRHPFSVRMKLGANDEGKILAMQADVYVESGAYASMGPRVSIKSALTMTGPYDIPNVWVDSHFVYTNNPFGGAMRGFGMTQGVFVYENMMDELAHALDMDPWELRHINATTPGCITAAGQALQTANLREILAAAKAYLASHPLEKRSSIGGE